MAGVGGQLDADVGAGGALVLAGCTEVVLHVAGTLHRGRVDVALELLEDLVVALADHVGEHAEPATVGHADRRRIETGVGGHRQDLVEDRDRRLCAFQTEPLGADVLGGQELLERLGRVEPLDDALLALLADGRLHAFDLRLDPAVLGEVLDVHVLDADRAAVRIAQHAEQVAELHLLVSADAAGEELAIEVPDRQAVCRRVELVGKLGLLPAQRIEVGDQVAANAVDADQRGDLHLLVQHRFFAVDRAVIDSPLHRLVRHAEALEHCFVEAVLAEQQLVHALQEHAALGALDDAVVVRAGDRDDLADAERAEGPLVGALELGRVVDGADADDHALAGHQPRHALDRADRAGVGQRDRGALEVADRQLVALTLRIRSSYAARKPAKSSVSALRSTGTTSVRVPSPLSTSTARPMLTDGLWMMRGLPSAPARERIVHVGYGVGDGADHGEADEVGEADLALTAAAAVAVDDLAVDLEQLGRDVAEAGRGRHRQAALHVGGDRGTGAADGLADILARRPATAAGGGRARRPVGGPLARRRRLRRRSELSARGGDCRLVVGEELPPGLADRLGIGSELLVHLLDEPRVRPEGRPGRINCSHRRLSVLVEANSGFLEMAPTGSDSDAAVAFPKP